MVLAALLFSFSSTADTPGSVSREQISPQEALSLVMGKSIPARPSLGSTIESSYQSFREDGTYEVSFESGFDRGHYFINSSRVCASTTSSVHCYLFYRLDEDNLVMIESENGAENHIELSSLKTSRGG